SGQTIGPFHRKFDKWYARFALNHAHMITFRDKSISKTRLAAIGVSKAIMLDTADDAMTIPAINKENALDLFHRETGWHRDKLMGSLVVVMNLKASLKMFKGLDRSGRLSNEIELMARIADELVQRYDARVYFIATDYNATTDDRELNRKILSKMSFASHSRCIDGEYPDSTLKGLIGLADVAIGSRYHFAVFAASQRVPFLGMASGIYQQTKLKGLADLCGLPRCFVKADMEFAEFGAVWPQVADFIANRHEIRAALEHVVPELELRSRTAVREAVRVLQQMREKQPLGRQGRGNGALWPQ
ncbi:MAG: polysaccharide pyruvyl transferase family protein, partial [Deltaproteobacteria bacterium]|nr:polysaccharide pyruvyl transferase family protein [Deltaproteobacteria bacterium]